ncbi:hypothetical protein AVEN_2742-1, partial [Araneus ventricosus]
MPSLQSSERTQNRAGKKSVTGDWSTSTEKLSDRTPRFPCDILFGRL